MSDRATATGPVSRVWPLVGRQAELEMIAAARADTACRGIVLSASAGAGKSRLARGARGGGGAAGGGGRAPLAGGARAAAEAQGELTFRVLATASSRTIPLGALAALIPDD